MGSFLNSLSLPHAKACNRPFPMISGMILGTQNGNMRGEKAVRSWGKFCLQRGATCRHLIDQMCVVMVLRLSLYLLVLTCTNWSVMVCAVGKSLCFLKEVYFDLFKRPEEGYRCSSVGRIST